MTSRVINDSSTTQVAFPATQKQLPTDLEDQEWLGRLFAGPFGCYLKPHLQQKPTHKCDDSAQHIDKCISDTSRNIASTLERLIGFGMPATIDESGFFYDPARAHPGYSWTPAELSDLCQPCYTTFRPLLFDAFRAFSEYVFLHYDHILNLFHICQISMHATNLSLKRLQNRGQQLREVLEELSVEPCDRGVVKGLEEVFMPQVELAKDYGICWNFYKEVAPRMQRIQEERWVVEILTEQVGRIIGEKGEGQSVDEWLDGWKERKMAGAIDVRTF